MMIIVTSIAPRVINNQLFALETWIEHGFSIVSLNTQQEINQLQHVYKNVNFYPVNRDARFEAGKPLVYLDDIFSYLQMYGTNICGIVNSDIFLKTDKNFLSFIWNISRDSVVLGSRIDVDSYHSLKGKFYIHGFDIFFFDKKLLKVFPPSKFCIGLPWWDYFIPSIVRQKGLNLKYLISPLIYHVKHQMRYSTELWKKGGIRFMEFFNTQLAKKYEDMLTNDSEGLRDHLQGLSYKVIQNIQQYSEKIEYVPLYLQRRRIAEHWLSISSDQIEIAYSADAGNLHRRLMESNIRNEALRQEENVFFQYILSELTKRSATDPVSAINYLLAAMLYLPAGKLKINDADRRLPGWLLEDYRKYF